MVGEGMLLIDRSVPLWSASPDDGVGAAGAGDGPDVEAMTQFGEQPQLTRLDKRPFGRGVGGREGLLEELSWAERRAGMRLRLSGLA